MDPRERSMARVAIMSGTIQLLLMITGDRWCTRTSVSRYLFPHAVEHIAAAVTVHLIIIPTQLLEDRWRRVRWETALRLVPNAHVHQTADGNLWLYETRIDDFSSVLCSDGLVASKRKNFIIPPPPSHLLSYMWGWFPYLSVSLLEDTMVQIKHKAVAQNVRITTYDSKVYKSKTLTYDCCT